MRKKKKRPPLPPARLGQPCDYCGRAQLVAARIFRSIPQGLLRVERLDNPRDDGPGSSLRSSVREICLACADPISDAPLVPASLSVSKFLQVKRAYEAYRRPLDALPAHVLEEMTPVPRWTSEPNTRVNYALVPVFPDGSTNPHPPRRGAGGAPRKFTGDDLKRVRLLHSKGWSAKRIAEDLEELWRGQGRSGYTAKVTPRSVNREIDVLRRSAKQRKRQ